MTSEDLYGYWRAALEGNVPARSPSEFETAACGRWKMKRNFGGEWDRLAVWFADHTNKFYWQFNDEPPRHSDTVPEIRGFAYALPASAEDYDAHARDGVWPGEVKGLLRNAKDITEYDQVRENVVEIASQAKAWMIGIKTISTQEQCDVAANYRQSLMNLSAKAKGLKDDEVKPLKAKVDACAKRWGSVITAADDVAREMRLAAEPFLIHLDQVAKQTAADIKQVIDKEYEELKDVDLPLALAAASVHVEPRKVSAGGQTGRKMGLQTKYTAVITDYRAALNHFADDPKVVELITALCNAGARSKEKKPIPGVEFKEERKAI